MSGWDWVHRYVGEFVAVKRREVQPETPEATRGMDESAPIILAMNPALTKAFGRILRVLQAQPWDADPGAGRHIDGGLRLIIGPGASGGPSRWLDLARDRRGPTSIIVFQGESERLLRAGSWHPLYREGLYLAGTGVEVRDVILWLCRPTSSTHPFGRLMPFLGTRTFCHQLPHYVQFAMSGNPQMLDCEWMRKLDDFSCIVESQDWTKLLPDHCDGPLRRFAELLRSLCGLPSTGCSGVRRLRAFSTAFFAWVENSERIDGLRRSAEEVRQIALDLQHAREEA